MSLTLKPWSHRIANGDFLLALAVWVTAPVPDMVWYPGALAIFALVPLFDMWAERREIS